MSVADANNVKHWDAGQQLHTNESLRDACSNPDDTSALLSCHVV